VSSIRQGGLHPERGSVPLRRWRGFAPREISALCNEKIAELHAGEAAFLWTRRARAVEAPNYRLKDLVQLDGRQEAHLASRFRMARGKGASSALALYSFSQKNRSPLLSARARKSPKVAAIWRASRGYVS